MSGGSSDTLGGLGARCAGHRERRAVDLCDRCGSFVCLGCVRSHAATVYCEGCLGRSWKEDSAPVGPSLQSSLALACVGLVLPPWAIAGLWFGWRWLRYFRRGTRPAREEALAKLTVRLAVAGLLFSAPVEALYLRQWWMYLRWP